MRTLSRTQCSTSNHVNGSLVATPMIHSSWILLDYFSLNISIETIKIPCVIRNELLVSFVPSLSAAFLGALPRPGDRSIWSNGRHKSLSVYGDIAFTIHSTSYLCIQSVSLGYLLDSSTSYNGGGIGSTNLWLEHMSRCICHHEQFMSHFYGVSSMCASVSQRRGGPWNINQLQEFLVACPTSLHRILLGQRHFSRRFVNCVLFGNWIYSSCGNIWTMARCVTLPFSMSVFNDDDMPSCRVAK